MVAVARRDPAARSRPRDSWLVPIPTLCVSTRLGLPEETLDSSPRWSDAKLQLVHSAVWVPLLLLGWAMIRLLKRDDRRLAGEDAHDRLRGLQAAQVHPTAAQELQVGLGKILAHHGHRADRGLAGHVAERDDHPLDRDAEQHHRGAGVACETTGL